MRRSLRNQLLIGTGLACAAVMLASGLLLHALIDRTLRGQFDESLAARARALAALVEQEGDEIEFELVETALPEFQDAANAEYFQLYREDGTVVARSPSLGMADLARLAGTPDAPMFQNSPLSGGRPGRLAGIAFTPRREGRRSATPPMRLTMVVGRELAILENTLATLRAALVGVGLLAVALTVAVLAWMVRRGLRPVNRLSRQIAGVGERDLAARIDPAGAPAELAPVVDRLNELLSRIEAAFQRERRFTGDVAHELRTPLAGTRSKLELALSRERPPEQYRRTMGECLEINHGMQRMVETLLHLARADAGQLQVRRTPVDLAAALRAAFEPLRETADARGLRIEWRTNGATEIDTDPDMLALLLHNVLENAVTHADEKGEVRIAASREDGHATVVVDNTGSAIRAADCERVFDRFWRGDASWGDNGGGHWGLGLPLCRAVVTRLGGDIRATSAEGRFAVMLRINDAAAARGRPMPASRREEGAISS